jgi:hypothetical protein
MFQVRVKEGLPSGTAIRDTADIIFDTNEPLNTGEWSNALDYAKPTSSVAPLAAAQDSNEFTVAWSGADADSGVHNYTIYVAEDDKPFAVWLQNTPATSAVFAGEYNRTYRFFSVARDRTGNLERDKTVAEATTTVGAMRQPQTITWATPADITHGTPLGAAQLSATVSVPGAAPAGAITYTPDFGTILPVGDAQTLTVNVAGTDSYLPATASVTINVRPPAPNQPTAFTPVADAYAQGADAFRNTNYGASTEMQVKRTLNPGSGRGRRAFLKFDLSSVTGAITSAKLRVFARLTDAALQPTPMIAQGVADTAWSEATITWNNQPGVVSPAALASITVAGAAGQWYEIDLTNYVNQERAAGRNVVSLRLINMERTGINGASYTSINSKEASANQPQLVVAQ